MNTQKKKPAATVSPVVVRLPSKLISDLDKAATKNLRSRSKEVHLRLAQSFAAGVRV